MTDNVVNTIEHAGLTIKIIHDDDAHSLNPRNNGAPFGRIVSWGIDGYSIGGDDDEDLGRYAEFEVECEHCEGMGEDPYCPELPPMPGWGVRQPDCPVCEGTGMREVSVREYFEKEYSAAVLVQLRFSDYGSGGTRLYEVSDDDDTNCVIFFTRDELAKEYSDEWLREQGCNTDEEREAFIKKQLMAHVNEYDNWAQGNVFGYVVAGPTVEDDDEPSGERIMDLEDVPGWHNQIHDSCWGFIGDYDDEYILSEAKSGAEYVRQQLDAEVAERSFWAARDSVTV